MKVSAQQKYLPNKNAFILLLKIDSEDDFLMWSVKLFQICGTENEKLLLPKFCELSLFFSRFLLEDRRLLDGE